MDYKKFQVNVELFNKILRICPRVPDEEFVAPPSHDLLVTFLSELGYKGQLKQLSGMFDDGVLGRLKFIGKCEATQVYGWLILDTMVNEEIKNSEAYQTYITLSIGMVPQKKGRGKGGKGKKTTTTPKKRSSITVDDNIIPYLKVALKLGESISKTKADEQEEARQMHATHERLVIEKLTNNDESDDVHDDRLITRTPTGVVIRDTLNDSKKKSLDQKQKLKGI
ncbi:hypothetical protein Tco_0186432, partial [Tanacetum coccineum]